ncbi:MAG: DNA repair protein RadC [Lachnospiraceae bacterium]|nr:DNA repair protein RadC [Lachnospiraceae bacterium]MBP3609097.1 DNA repair protein RadC [Lachnospiraceae bacterium]
MNNKPTMKELPFSERPYEKVETEGVEKLSDKELLTVFIHTGTKTERADQIALRLLELCGENGLQALWGMDLAELRRVSGIGRVKAIQLVCACELSRRMARGRRLFGTKITSPEDIVSYYNIQLKYQQKESLILVVLDSKGRIAGEELLSVGTVQSSVADPREIFLSALKKNGVSIILLHNHPSGDPTPSREDILTTERIEQAGELLGIQLKDHIIVGQNSYISMRSEGYLGSFRETNS